MAELDAQIAQQKLAMWGTTERIPPEELDPREVWWRDRYKTLSDHGYLLRPRYSPQWVPSWKTLNKNWKDCEDSKRIEVRGLLPVRLQAGLHIILVWSGY